ncbi:hypothetical protein WT15_27300 [Burkholderia stagnalis]|uniref:hypothetical protein n=1 Tax=Burkholderia stagnalis TaxID=1503054 RepID=UPI000755DFE6|nr:hypothetical protein [Burkholderia stagnalis]KVN72786.1 hypothetical protein WT15_27300 [Burkholderia stagnalis]KWO38166.1 hypothetical protein WT96_12665 [Burkholderia stagnalis]KWO44455.1 hypothetical protein WT95_29530 [Burkholderia stagnalis]
MSVIVHKRILGERVQTLIRKSQPELTDLQRVCEALADVMTDVIGAQCRIKVCVDADALQKAISGQSA